MACGYSRSGSEVVECPPLISEMLQGAGALYSTVGDLLRWDEALHSNRLAGPETTHEMFTPGLQEFGFGWFRSRVVGRMAWAHNGSISGFGCRVVRFPDEHVYIVVLGNFDWIRPDEIVAELSRLVFASERHEKRREP